MVPIGTTGDFLDFASIEKAVEGVSTVYFAYPVQEGLLDATVNMAVAARNAGVTRLVDYLSEQVFEGAGIGAAHVRATVFVENVRSLADAALAAGMFMAPFGDDSTVIPLVAGAVGESAQPSRPREFAVTPTIEQVGGRRPKTFAEFVAEEHNSFTRELRERVRSSTKASVLMGL